MVDHKINNLQAQINQLKKDIVKLKAALKLTRSCLEKKEYKCKRDHRKK